MDQNKDTAARLAKVEMQQLWDQVTQLNKRIDYWRQILDANCQHTSETVRSKYYEGGYDYVSTVHVTHTCDVCGKILKAYNDPNHKGTHA